MDVSKDEIDFLDADVVSNGRISLEFTLTAAMLMVINILKTVSVLKLHSKHRDFNTKEHQLDCVFSFSLI